ncbi:MAG: PolC-type DNA polymerase III [Firmicutes bacterium]|nr:PolC-type DNA polymerase III [Bacillota bacterium]
MPDIDLLHFIDDQTIPAFTREALSQAEVSQVEVDPTEKALTIQLCLKRPVPAGCLTAIGEGIKEKLPGLSQVRWQLNYALNTEIEIAIVGYWSELVSHLVVDLPVFRGWLEDSTAGAAENGELVITLKNAAAKIWLEKKGAAEQLSDWLRQVLDWSPRVFWEIEDHLMEPEEPEIEVYTYTAKEKKAEETPRVFWGREIRSNPVPVSEITQEERTVTVQGYLFDLEARELKSGRTSVVFSLSDYTDSIAVRFYLNESEAEGVIRHLQEGRWLLVRGYTQVERFSQELALFAQDLNLGPAPSRRDDLEEKRVELHLHTKMSSMDGLVDVHDLIKRVAEWGQGAVAITDHGVVQAFPEAYDAGKKHGVKVIFGMEGYLTDSAEKGKSSGPTYHILIIVKNYEGLKNLYQLVSHSHLECFYRRPRLLREELVKHREGLLFGTACEAGELIQAYLQGGGRERLKEVASFYDFIEVQPRGNNEFLVRNGQLGSLDDLTRMNITLVEIAEEVGMPAVATGDVHFLDPHDECFRRIIQTGKGFEDAESQAPLYLRTTAEMLEEFSHLGEERAWRVVVEAPRSIAAQVEDIKPVPSELHAPTIEGAEDKIMRMSYQNAKELYGDPLPDLVKKRLEKELGSIINNGFSVLYLIAHYLVKKSNEDGYLVGSRGSVGSSLVATFTGITEVNPLPPHYRCPECKNSEFFEDGRVGCGADLPDQNCPNCGAKYRKDGFNIPFETFLGFEGDKVPDIDLNFSGDYQPHAHRYVEEMFGSDYVFRAGTISTIAEKTAFGFVRKYLDEQKITARNPEIKRLVKGCTGVKRTTGQHPGGLMVVPKGIDVHKFTPIQRPADDVSSGVITTHFAYESISSRLVKLDILGHDDPTVIRMLEEITGVDPKEIPLDEPRTMQLFSSTEVLGVTPEQINSNIGTYGIPEFGTRFVRQMLEDTRPSTFSDLVRISGFSHGTDVWLNNAQDLIKSGKVKLADAISTRDDIMTYLIQNQLPPSLAFKIMEDVRKGKGLKPQYETDMRSYGVPDWYLESCNKINYMFPKAHAVAYVTMAYRIAYCKVYHPEAFYASFFTVRADEFDAQLMVGGSEKVRAAIAELEAKGNDATAKERNLLTILEVALEMYERGIDLLPVSLEDSDASRFIITPKGLLPPLKTLPGLGLSAAASVVEARQARPFTSVEDLRLRTRVSKTVIDIMNQHGCLRGLPETDQLSLFG